MVCQARQRWFCGKESKLFPRRHTLLESGEFVPFRLRFPFRVAPRESGQTTSSHRTLIDSWLLRR